MDLELIQAELSKMDMQYWANKYETLKLARENIKTVDDELKAEELLKNYFVAELKYYGYIKILNNEDPGDVKLNIDKLEKDFINLKIEMEMRK